MSDDLFDVFLVDSSAAANANRQDDKTAVNPAKNGKSTPSKSATENETTKSKKNTKRKLDDDDEREDEDTKQTKENDEMDDANSNKRFQEEDYDNWRENETLPRITVLKLSSLERCSHEVAIPNDMDYQPLKNNPNTVPAKEYPFTLDPFQKEAILCLENHQSVLVSAHTSAGKTVIAEYVIAMSLKAKQRVIYTTPIKALSNQKYRELFEEFKDVGLMTGDVTINPSASCLIMTTEILRSMLYRGSEITREVAWVIFDEIHYMRDKERGVIWEETIILLNDNVHYVFLSATIPNARQFAEWITYLHKQPCHVVYTDFRPTPLQHYIYPAGGDGIHLVVDENGNFREDNFNKAMMVLKEAPAEIQPIRNKFGKGGSGSGGAGGANLSGGNSNESSCYKVLQTIMDKSMAPVIVFSFSKKECEAYAVIAAKSDYNSDEEKRLVQQVFSNAISILSEEDQKLPQVESVLPLLKKGIGIHHSGMLPVLKETIEILFSEGLLKVLFATETFAMGLNMPARTVLFTSCRKFDGKENRWITSGEYIQMSGRAGRRGLDDKGIVILMIDERMSPSAAKDIVKGQANFLNSAFHLTYNMVLNLLRVEGINPEFMLQRSFFQFQNYANIPTLCEKLNKLEVEHNSIKFDREHEIANYFNLRQQIESLRHQLASIISLPKHIINFINPGRLINVVNKNDNFAWGVVVNFRKRQNNKNDAEPIYTIDTLLYVTKESAKSGYLSEIKPCPPDQEGVMHIVPIQPSVIRAISSVCIYLPQNLQSLDSRMSVWKTIKEIKKRTKGAFPLLDPVEDMGIKDKSLVEIVKKIELIEEQIVQHKLHKDPEMAELYKKYEKKALIKNELKQAKSELKKAWSLIQMEDLKCRKRVLRRLGYCNEQDVIDTKGRVACEIDTGDELVLTEMLFNGVFNDLTVAQCVALCSCFVVTENVKEDVPKLTQELAAPYKIMQETAKRVATVSKECKLDVEIDEYVDSLKPYLMDIMNEWVNGASFAKICSMTSIFEGNIIRHIRRLEELLRQMSCASKAIGNTTLEAKFNDAILKIKRDIVFAASLYL